MRVESGSGVDHCALGYRRNDQVRMIEDIVAVMTCENDEVGMRGLVLMLVLGPDRAVVVDLVADVGVGVEEVMPDIQPVGPSRRRNTLPWVQERYLEGSNRASGFGCCTREKTSNRGRCP